MFSSAFLEYVHCVTSGAAHISAGVGYPDGDNRPSVTLDCRASYTIRPSGGTVRFIILPTSTGAFSHIVGTFAASVPRIITGTNPSATTGWTSTSAVPQRGVIPMMQLNSPTGGWGTSDELTYNSFRCVSLVADVIYSGSSMMDNGSVLVSRMPYTDFIKDSLPHTYSSSATQTIPENSPSMPYSGSLFTNTVIQPARKSFTATCIPAHSRYVPCQPAMTDYDNFICTATNLSPAAGMYPAPTVQDSNMIVVEYSGLDSTASITVTLRYCVQLAINTYSITSSTPLISLARPSPSVEPSYLARFALWFTQQPIVRNLGQSLANRALQYVAAGYPQARPLLALMH